MTRLYVLDVPENAGVVTIAQTAPAVIVDKIGPYFRVTSDSDIVIDRRATGCRHAVWYSVVAGLEGCRRAQHDKDALRISAT